MRPFLARFLSSLDRNLGDPATSRRLSEEQKFEILDIVRSVLRERLLRASGQESLIGYTEASINLVAGQSYYGLPGNFRQFLSFEKRNSSGGIIDKLGTIDFKDSGPGILILSGQRGFRCVPTPGVSDDWVLTYLKGPITLHNGTATSVTANTLVFAETPSTGECIAMDNYYAGALVKIYSATTGVGQIKEIRSYNAATRTATLRENWDVTPTGTILYEILPELPYGLDDIYAGMAALDLTPGRNLRQKGVLIADKVKEKLSACINYFANNVADRTPEPIISEDPTMPDPYQVGY